MFGLTGQQVAIQARPTTEVGVRAEGSISRERLPSGRFSGHRTEAEWRGARQAPGLLVTGTAVGLGLGGVC